MQTPQTRLARGACISDRSQTSSGAGEFIVYTDGNSLDVLLA
jgi:hypothetical protein